MTLFKTKKILLTTIFIIVLGIILWLLRDNFIQLKFFQKQVAEEVNKKPLDSDDAYLEKIDNFIIKEYSKGHALLHIIQAKTYYSYKNSPIQLIDVKVKTFNEAQDEGHVLTSNRAEILKSGEVIFNGDVNIKTKTGISHELNTEELIVASDNGQIKSNKEITYLGKDSIIKAQGMEMDKNADKISLIGSVNIIQNSGATIDTSNLFVSHSDGEKIYKSKEKTIYKSKTNIINSDEGMDIDMNQNLINLLGKVEIKTLPETTILSSNILIDQSNGQEVYTTNEPTYYQSGNSDIRAKKMYYDAITKKIDLVGRVRAIYD
jgi:LPS export ABC transporter protein LptC